MNLTVMFTLFLALSLVLLLRRASFLHPTWTDQLARAKQPIVSAHIGNSGRNAQQSGGTSDVHL